MTASLTGAYTVNSTTNTANQTITTASFTPATGDLLVLKVVTEDTSTPGGTPTATGGGITWIKVIENKVVSTTYAAIWSGVVTTGGSAITASISESGGGASYMSMTVEDWSGAQLAPGPSTAHANGSGAASANITLYGNSKPGNSSSILSWCSGDSNAQTTTPTYLGTPTQDGYHAVNGAYTAYYAYQFGAQEQVLNFGMSAPTGQVYTIMGVEIQNSTTTNIISGTMMTMGVGI